jgi:hypothetical protein
MIVIFTFLCVMVVTAVLFGGWVIMSIGRLIGRAFAGPPQAGAVGRNSRCCANPGCRTMNPLHGTNLANPMGNVRFNAPPQQPQFNPNGGNVAQVARA